MIVGLLFKKEVKVEDAGSVNSDFFSSNFLCLKSEQFRSIQLMKNYKVACGATGLTDMFVPAQPSHHHLSPSAVASLRPLIILV
ncbi:hypothetical protein PAMP_006448 [Pampus punctatissimus]